MLFRYFVFCAIFLRFLRAEVFTSVQDLAQMFAVEKKVADALSSYLSRTEAELEKIRMYLREYEQVRSELKEIKSSTEISAGLESEPWEKLTENPLHTYHLIKRLTIHWKKMEKHDPKLDWKGVEDALLTGDLFGFSQLSNEEDLKGSAESLIRLQSIYQLNTTSLVHGNVWGFQTSAEMTAQDCLYLGKLCFNAGSFFNAIEWFDQAYVLAGLEKNQTISQNEVISFLNAAVKAYEDSNAKANPETKNEKEKHVNNPYSITRTRRIELAKKVFNVKDNLSTDLGRYEALCRGEQLLSNTYIATLKCFYDTRNTPYLILMPAKVEQFYHEPPIVMFHDVIREKQIAKIKANSLPTLSRGLVQDATGKERKGVVSNMRTSKITWMTAIEEMETYGRLNYLTECLSGLSTNPFKGGEQLQVANYGVGGHYQMHWDFLFKDKSEEQLELLNKADRDRGDRIATLMFYLSDVRLGGATSFPRFGTSVLPVKGSAIFWYNLKKSGEVDYRTLHGGCPVVHGTKWVANKWIREPHQFNRRLCGMTEDE